MKKITTLFSALVLTAFGWQANAQVLSEGFDGGAIPAGWTQEYASGTKDWGAVTANGNASITPRTGSHMAEFRTTTGGDITKLITLPLDLTTLTTPQLTFYYANVNWFGDIDALKIYYKNSAGGVWTQIGIDYTAEQTTWTEVNLILPNPSNDYYLAFEGISAYARGINVDDVLVGEAPSCPAPTALNAANITTTTADLGWTENGTATAWDIEWSTTGFTPTGTPTTTGATNTQNVTGLTASTSYEFYVRADCGGGDMSTWSGPYAFSTLPNSVSVPYTQDFEGGSLADFGISTAAESAITLDAGSNCAGNNSLYFTGNTGTGFAGSSNSGTATDAWVTNVSHHAQSILNVDASAVTNSLILTFDLKQEFSYGPTYSWFRVLVNGTQVSADYNPTTTDTDPCATQTIDLTAYIGTTFTLAFQSSMKYNNAEGNSSQGDNAFLDNISITEVTCLAPTTLTATNITATFADLGWTENGSATAWDIELGTAGFTPTGTPTTTGATNTQNVTGLTASTSYEFYVRADCGGGDMSTWSGPFMFTTAIQAPVGVTCTTGTAMFIFSEDFDAQGTWTGDISATPNDGDWILPHSGTTVSTATGPDSAYSNSNYVYYEASIAAVDTASLVSPMIDLSNAANEAELSFWMHAYGADMGTLKVGVSTSATGPFTTEFTYSGELQTAGTDAWQAVGVNLNAYVGQQIYIEFNYNIAGGYNGDMALDLVKVETCDIGTGVNAIANNVNLTVYPNPTTGVFTLNVNTTDVNELDIKVMNMQGQVVFAKNNFDNIANVNEQIDLSENANGIYFVTVTTDKGVITHKVVVQ